MLDSTPALVQTGPRRTFLRSELVIAIDSRVDQGDTSEYRYDALGRRVYEHGHQPFQLTADPDGDGQRVTSNLGYPGPYFDAETGLRYNYFGD